MTRPAFSLILALVCAACSGEGRLQHVPRERTLITDCVDQGTCSGQFQDYDAFNPYLPGKVSRTGYNFLYEPLYFYNAYRDEIIPWIATGHEYNEDYTEVSIKIRPGVEWSDGQPWTAHDVVFTINMLRDHAPELTFAVDMQTWVKTAVASDSLTARIALTAPNPRFVFTYFTHNFDNGVPIVPRHIWEGQDPKTFANFDLARGWPVVSGPYRLVHSVPEQRIWDRRDGWWAAKIGFRQPPQVERLIYLPYMEEAKQVQNLATNAMDLCADMLPPNIRTILAQNSKVTTWSGQEPPYGYLDWWPLSLGFNVQEPPYDEPAFRWAVNHAINREQLVEVGWQGAGRPTLLPFPDFPRLRHYTGQVQDLLKQHPVGLFDPARSAALMQESGWHLDAEGIWTRDGMQAKILLDISQTFQDIAPILVEQLQRAGFAANMRMTSDNYTRMTTGAAKTYIFGNGGSVRDPYFTLRLYHSRFVQPTGTATPNFWRWKNPEYDALVDQMGQTAPDDPRLVGLLREALAIWLGELPAIPLLQFYHRLPHNQTYWRNWPSADNPYINTAYWHRTWLLVLLNLQPTRG